jgi:hypothetical protein
VEEVTKEALQTTAATAPEADPAEVATEAVAPDPVEAAIVAEAEVLDPDPVVHLKAQEVQLVDANSNTTESIPHSIGG